MPASAGEKRARVFVSYSWSEKVFVKALNSSLEQRGTEPWVDWKDIRPTEKWLKRILAAIESTDLFVFVVTPESCQSRVCQLEVNHAEEHRKHIVPVLRRPVAPQNLPRAVASLQWIQFTEEDDAEQALETLLAAINTDLEWVSAHTLYLERALEWQRRGYRAADTLRGAGLVEAEKWLLKADDERRVPTPIHREFLRASRKTQQRNRFMLGMVLLLACLALAWQIRQRSLSDEQARASQAEAAQSKLEATNKEREAIMSEIAADKNGRPSPLNLSRRKYLEYLLQRARIVKYSEAEATLHHLVRQIPPDSARRALISADSSRLGVVASLAEDLIFVWYSDRIETLTSSGERLKVFRPTLQGRILWVALDTASSGLLFEVEYPDFADTARARQVKVSGSSRFLPIQPWQEAQAIDLPRESEIFGSERERFLLPTLGGKAQSLGLTRRLKSFSNYGDRDLTVVVGFLYREVDEDAPSLEQLMLQRYWNPELAMALVRQAGRSTGEVEVEALAYDFRSRAVLLEVRSPWETRTYPEPVEYTTIWTALLNSNGEIARWTEKVNYTDQARFFQRAVPDLKQVVALTDVRPQHKPAALTFRSGSGAAVLSNRIVRGGFGKGIAGFSTKMDWVADEIGNVRFTPDGRNVIAVYHDRRIGIYDGRKGQQLRLFVGADPKVRSVSHSADGRFVFLFEEDRAVTRWDMSAFGPDGWAARRRDS